MAQIILSLSTGLSGGPGAIVLWEGVFKPRRLRKKVGAVLEVEMGQNLSRIVRARRLHQSGGPRQIDLTLSRIGFEVVAADLSELPAGAPRVFLISP
jgi:hypothetical protein